MDDYRARSLLDHYTARLGWTEQNGLEASTTFVDLMDAGDAFAEFLEKRSGGAFALTEERRGELRYLDAYRTLLAAGGAAGWDRNEKLGAVLDFIDERLAPIQFDSHLAAVARAFEHEQAMEQASAERTPSPDEFIRAIAGLSLWGAGPDAADECAAPDEGSDDSHEALMGLIQEARKIVKAGLGVREQPIYMAIERAGGEVFPYLFDRPVSEREAYEILTEVDSVDDLEIIGEVPIYHVEPVPGEADEDEPGSPAP